MSRPRSWLLAHPEAVLEIDQWARLVQSVRALEAGQPLPYVLGHWEFFGLDFELTPDVLIPRPETELLVEEAIRFLTAHSGLPQRIADVGTGSGVIAVSLAKAVPGLTVVAVDRSRAALDVARRNAIHHDVDNSITFYQGSLLEAVFTPFDVIAANLPYIPTTTLQSLPVAKHEPRMALDGGPDGLDAIRRLLADVPRLVHPGSLVLLEIEETLGKALKRLVKKALPNAKMEIKTDFSGRDRLAVINIAQNIGLPALTYPRPLPKGKGADSYENTYTSRI
jgi:release factor glutamine methyltransferase